MMFLKYVFLQERQYQDMSDAALEAVRKHHSWEALVDVGIQSRQLKDAAKLFSEMTVKELEWDFYEPEEECSGDDVMPDADPQEAEEAADDSFMANVGGSREEERGGRFLRWVARTREGGESVRARFIPWTAPELARYIAPRLGVDFGYSSGKKTAELGVGVEMIMLMADAKEKDTYSHLQAKNVVPELIYIDPPFGINKHSEGDDKWDEPKMKWGYRDVQEVLEGLHANKLLPDSSGFSLAVYMCTEDVGEFVHQMEAWGKERPQKVCGHLTIALGKDGEAYLQPGTRSNGHFQSLVVLKMNNGHKTVVADDAGGHLGGRFTFSFPRPEKRSRYMRPELDAVLCGDLGEEVNRTQKSIDECRLIIRLCTPNQGWVLSICNGTGTAMIAAALEGRSCVGVEKSVSQNVMCMKRIDTFLHKEGLLLAALEEDRNPGSAAVRQLVQESTDVGQLMDTAGTTQGEVVLTDHLKSWLEYLEKFKQLSVEYAGLVLLAPYYLKSLLVDHITHLGTLDHAHLCFAVFDRKDWKKLVFPIATAGQHVPVKVVKRVITLCRKIDSNPSIPPIKDSPEMEACLWSLVEGGVSDEDKKEFHAKFAFPESMAPEDKDAAYDRIEEEFIDKEDVAADAGNPDVSMGC
jgi:hypothetical protein